MSVSCTTLAQQQSSICQSMHYRSLSAELQNEHQCMILERLQEEFVEEKNVVRNHHNQLVSMLSRFQDSIYRSVSSLNLPSKDSSKAIPLLRDVPLARDCDELYMNGIKLSGVYPIRLPNRNILNVKCDMDTAHGGWTVVQRRMDGSVNFTRQWDDYAFGFGNVNSEYWVGNENLYWLSHFKNYSIRFDLWDWEDKHAYASYDYFRVESEQLQYKLTIEGYSGTAGDAMSTYHNNMKFSTIDRDNDEWHLNCAKKDQSGWWYRACGFASLNGLYILNGTIDMAPDGLVKGIIWYNWKRNFGYSMKKTEIKIKPLIQVKLDRLKEGLRKTPTEKKKGGDNSKIDSQNSDENTEQEMSGKDKENATVTSEKSTEVSENTTTESYTDDNGDNEYEEDDSYR